MAYRYVVLGAGPLASAAVYDLALNGEASEVILADADLASAKEAIARVTRLLKDKKVKLKALEVDPSRKADLAKAFKDANGVLSTLAAALNPAVAQAAVLAKAHYCDVGSPLETSRAIFKLQAAAKKAGVSLVPDCGLSPGLSSCLAVATMYSLDFARDVRIYCGSLPQRAAGPLEHGRVHPTDSLLSLYLEPGLALHRSRVEPVDAMSEREELEVAGVGSLEACMTGGGGSTCPYSFQNRLVSYEHKTLRYPGEFEKINALRAMGFLSDKPVETAAGRVAPRELFLALAEKAWADQEEKDLVVLRVSSKGKKHGKPTEATYELVDRFDPVTKFSAIERTTACAASASLHLQVRGKVKPGADAPENALPCRDYVGEIRRRGLRLSETLKSSTSKA